jgi:hypothetical protein
MMSNPAILSSFARPSMPVHSNSMASVSAGSD